MSHLAASSTPYWCIRFHFCFLQSIEHIELSFNEFLAAILISLDIKKVENKRKFDLIYLDVVHESLKNSLKDNSMYSNDFKKQKWNRMYQKFLMHPEKMQNSGTKFEIFLSRVAFFKFQTYITQRADIGSVQFLWQTTNHIESIILTPRIMIAYSENYFWSPNVIFPNKIKECCISLQFFPILCFPSVSIVIRGR